MVPALLSATGFAAYRGLLDTVTPLKVSLFTNALNLVLDPLFIFQANMGFVGAALATAISETSGGLIYLRLLLKNKLVTWKKLFRLPSWAAIWPIIQGGSSILARQAAINVAIVSAARRAQAMDPTGVAAAAYGIVMNLYSVGIVMHVAIQSTAAALIPATRAKEGTEAATKIADRIFAWGTIVGALLGTTQYLALPFLVPLFSTLPEVQQAVKGPAVIASCLHFFNGIVFAGEGALLGLGCFRDLALLTAGGVLTLVALLSTSLGQSLEGILIAMAIFNAIQGVSVLTHYLKIGPLARKRGKGDKPATESV
jgi:Na+-driven multidrug efflux pump